MLEVLRARLRRRRTAVFCVVALLGATMATTHTVVADHHMGDAAAMCLAIVVGGAAVATLPRLGEPVPRRRAPLRLAIPRTPLALVAAAPPLPRGDPAVLQVFRR